MERAVELVGGAGGHSPTRVPQNQRGQEESDTGGDGDLPQGSVQDPIEDHGGREIFEGGDQGGHEQPGDDR